MVKILNSRILLLPVLAGLLACSGRDSSADKPSPSNADKQRARAELEYETIQTELFLAAAGKPYLVMDFSRKMISLRLKGATVWDYPLDYELEDSAEVSLFPVRFAGRDKKLMRPIAERYLFRAADQTPDSVLEVIGEAVNVDPELLQRELPERFQLAWQGDIALEIHSDISGRLVSPVKNAMVEIRQAMRRPLGRTVLVLSMKPEDALTLYRAATIGMPTLAIADNN
jgi:hypothetical protein